MGGFKFIPNRFIVSVIAEHPPMLGFFTFKIMNNDAYKYFPNLQKMSRIQRILAFKETVFELLHTGFPVQDIKQAIADSNECEQYELSQAITECLSEFYGKNLFVKPSVIITSI